MSFISSKDFALSIDDRLQIAIEKGFSVDVLTEMFGLHPISVVVTGYSTETVFVRVRFPTGFKVSFLTIDESAAGYYADIDNQCYQRLVLPIDEGISNWFISLRTDQEPHLFSLYTQPLVIKPLMVEGKSPALMFAAKSDFSIFNQMDSRTRTYSTSPDDVPDALLRLVEVVDSPLPDTRMQLEYLQERLTSTLRVLGKQAEMRMTNKATEELAHATAEVEDYLLQVKSKLVEVIPVDIYSDKLNEKCLAKLKELLGAKKFEAFLGAAHRETRKEIHLKSTARKLVADQRLIAHLFEQNKDESALPDVRRWLQSEFAKTYSLHPCRQCGDLPMIGKDKTGRKFSVVCNCGNQIAPELFSSRQLMSMNYWNRENAPADPDFWAARLQVSEETPKKTKARLNRGIALLGMMTKQSKDLLGKDAEKNAELESIRDLSDILRTASLYLG